LLITLTWCIASCVFAKDYMRFQGGITVILLLSVVEEGLWAADYSSYNSVGLSADWVNIVGALLTSSKLTLVRVLVLLVSSGYQITRPTLTRGFTIGLIILTISYLSSEVTVEYIVVAQSEGLVVNPYYEIIAKAANIATNGIFFGWIGYEMIRTIQTLKRVEKLKFQMYRVLGILLIVSLSFSIVVTLAQLVIELLDQIDIHFRAWWLWNSYWEFIYFACVLVVAWIWRPTSQNHRYAYSQLVVDDIDDGEVVELDETVTASLEKREKTLNGSGGEEKTDEEKKENLSSSESSSSD